MRRLLCFVAFAGCFSGSLAQGKIDPNAPRWEDDYAKLSMVAPESFTATPIGERGKETNTIVRFSAPFARNEYIVRALIAVYENPKGQTLNQWSESGKLTWMTEPGYKELKYRQVEWKGYPTTVHEFQYHLIDSYGKPAGHYRCKSIRLMRQNRGYWFFFYASPSKYDGYVRIWDQALQTIEFLPL